MSSQPDFATLYSLADDLRALGLQAGMTVVVHTSLKALGNVNGGPVAVILALEDVLGPEGTLVMPTHTSDLSDPANWRIPPIPAAEWWPLFRQTMPPYDPDMTPTYRMGVVAETFRKQRGVKRSNNPDASFAAWGKHRDYITQDHPLYPLFGEDSPVGRIYALGGWVLMLGVGHGTNTSLHLAEYRANIHHPIRHDGRPLWVNGRIEWQAHDDIDWDDDDFEALGADFARETGLQKEGPVAFGQALLVPQVPLIDYGVKWLESHRAKPG